MKRSVPGFLLLSNLLILLMAVVRGCCHIFLCCCHFLCGCCHFRRFCCHSRPRCCRDVADERAERKSYPKAHNLRKPSISSHSSALTTAFICINSWVYISVYQRRLVKPFCFAKASSILFWFDMELLSPCNSSSWDNLG